MPLFYNFYLNNINVGKEPDAVSTVIKAEKASNLFNIIDYLYKYAFIDSMTGLKNRNAYEETMRYLRSTPSKLSGLRVAMIDIDKLKSINDHYGHDAGDAAIKTVGTCIVKAFGTETLSFRYGGDEFVCMSFTDVSENIEKFNQFMSTEKLSFEFPLNASVGWAEYDQTIDVEIDALMRRCDNIMYSNKNTKKALSCEADFNLLVCSSPA